VLGINVVRYKLLAFALGAAFAGVAGVLMGVFCAWYGAWRFATDFLRVNDERLLGLTGAQLLMIAVVAGGLWVWTSVVPSLEVDAPDRRAGHDGPSTRDTPW